MAPKTMLQRLSLICLISSTVPSALALSSALSAAQVLGVLEGRDLTCANLSSTACSTIDSRLPGDICCGSGTSCISIDNGTSAICCPNTLDCSAIQPITCDISLQNPSKHPDAAIQTILLNSTLDTCGDTCCPFGYSCAGSICLLNIDESKGFHQKGIATSVPDVTSTSSPTATATGPSGIDSSKSQTSGSCNKFPAAAVAAGFFPGMLTGALLTIVLVLFCGRRKTHESRWSSDSSNYKSQTRGCSHDNKYGISDPIPLETQSARSDFLGRTTTRAKSFFSTKSPQVVLDDSWKMPTPPVPNNIPQQMSGGLVPVTPERQVREEMPRQPSTESITVYSPPATSQVAPVRGMASQRADSAIGSPFKTPPNKNNTYHDAVTTMPTQTPYAEVLTPARYGESQTQMPPSDLRNKTRPRDTTFTMVMENAGMPDPLRGAMPSMPPVPKGLNVKGKGKNEWR